jgi:aminoglycoside phosphotransferase (APT) family kinase protein
MSKAAAPSFLDNEAFIEQEMLSTLEQEGLSPRPRIRGFRLVDTEDPTKITAEYTLEDGAKLFAKVYSGDEEDGAYCLQVMRTLREQGFASDSRYQVAEPLAYLPDRRVLVVRGVPGECLVDYLGTNSPTQFQGVCEAASWLAHLHESPVRVGQPWYIWQNFYRLAHRLAKATARRPAHSSQLRGMLDRLAGLAPSAEAPRFAQTHGQFRDVHVYLNEQVVSVIDFDRSLPADPAKDLDEFLHRLRWKTFKHTRQRADGLTAAFLQAYAAAAPAENLLNLPFYWAYHALYSLARFVRSKGPHDPDWEAITEFYTAEFEAAANGQLRALIEEYP